MSEIKRGGLVMVVTNRGGCGCADKDLGAVFTAGDTYHGLSKCGECGRIGNYSPYVWVGPGNVKPIFRLKKIDPPSSGEYDRVPLRLKEPA